MDSTKDKNIIMIREVLRLIRKEQKNVAAFARCQLAHHLIVQQQVHIDGYPSGDRGIGAAVKDTIIALVEALRPNSASPEPRKAEWYSYVIVWNYYLNPTGRVSYDLIGEDLGKPPGLTLDHVKRLHGKALRQMAEILSTWTMAEHHPYIPNITDTTFSSGILTINTIPSLPKPFLGREHEFETLENILFPKNVSLQDRLTMIVITGLGGMGKTALAHAFAKKYQSRFSDAQISIEFQGSTERPLTPEESLQRILIALGVNIDGAIVRADLASIYRKHCVSRRILIIANDVGSVDQVQDLIPSEGSLLIITSRKYIPLPGLEHITLAPLADTAARQLLLARYPEISNHAKELADLCSNIPLALVLASSFLKKNPDWTIAEYINELRQHPPSALTLGEASIHAILATTMSHLTQIDAQSAWAWHTLAVFPTFFDKPAMSAIWVFDKRRTQQIIDQLREYSLINYIKFPSGYIQHDLLRNFAITSLIGEDLVLMGRPTFEEWSNIQTRHALHYRLQARNLNEKYHQLIQEGESIKKVLNDFDRIWPHFQAAWNWMLQNETSEALHFIVVFPSDLLFFLELRLSLNERLRFLEIALTAARTLGYEKAQSVHLSNMAMYLIYLADFNSAINYIEEAIKIDHKLELIDFLSADYNLLGLAYLNRKDLTQNDLDNAITVLNTALALAQEKDLSEGRIIALSNLAEVYFEKKNLLIARDFAIQAMEQSFRNNDVRTRSFVLAIYGEVEFALGNHELGLQYLHNALAIDNDLGDKYGISERSLRLSSAYKELGQYDKAIEYLQTSVDFEQKVGSLEANIHAYQLEELKKYRDKIGENRTRGSI